MDVGNLISGSSAFSKTSLNTWEFSVHVLLKPSLEHFEHYFASMWDGRNCAVVWVQFGIALLWDWNENWPFPVLWLSFPNLLAHECSTFTASFFRIWNSSAGISSPPLALLVVMLCLTQWNYESWCVGLPKRDRSWWRVLTKHHQLEKGMGNHFSILALRNPWIVWKK